MGVYFPYKTPVRLDMLSRRIKYKHLQCAYEKNGEKDE